MSFHPFAVIKDMALARYERDDKGPLGIGEQRLPVEVDPKPDYDPATEYLDTTPGVDAARGVVRLVYSKHIRKPRPAPAATTVVVEQADTSGLQSQLAALKAQVLEMQAASHLSWLCFTAANAETAEASKARSELEPIAKARGITVAHLIEHVSAAQAAAAAAAMQSLKGGA